MHMHDIPRIALAWGGGLNFPRRCQPPHSQGPRAMRKRLVVKARLLTVFISFRICVSTSVLYKRSLAVWHLYQLYKLLLIWSFI